MDTKERIYKAIETNPSIYIRRFRRAAKLTQLQLAKLVGISSMSTIWAHENGARMPMRIYLERYVEVFYKLSTDKTLDIEGLLQ